MNTNSVGIHLRYPEPFVLRDVVELLSEIDRLDFDCIYVADQVASFLEPMEFLSFAAAKTFTARQGTCIYLLPLRNPFYVAKQVASIQRLSGKKFTLGIGVGWRKGEFDLLGIDWEKRGSIADESLQVLNLAWENDTFSYKGRFFSAEQLDLNCRLDAKPEVLVGGNSKRAMKRAVRFGEGWVPTDFTLQDYQQNLPFIKKMLKEMNRDTANFKIASHLLLSLGKDNDAAVRIASHVAKDFGVEVEEMSDWSLVGIPSVVAERIASYNSLGVNYHILALPSSLPTHILLESLNLLAKEVLPSV